jgi:hypothetical protein
MILTNSIGQAVDLAKNSDSTIIILLVIIVILAIASIPFIKTLSAIETKKRKEEYSRETMLIRVIEKNTEVNSALKTLIETDQKHCADCRQEQLGNFRKIFDNQEIANVKLAEIAQKINLKEDDCK